MNEILCTCAHLSSDHEILEPYTDEQFVEYGSPCNICHATPNRQVGGAATHMMCREFTQWPINAIPYPGSIEARELGCTCPSAENVEQAAKRAVPVFDDSCLVHAWVCRTQNPCVHRPVGLIVDAGSSFDRRVDEQYEIDHRRPHYSCEHCTVPQIECDTCRKVWVDWRVSPKKCGWVQFTVINSAPTFDNENRTFDGSTATVTWRCSTCVTS